MCGIAGFTRFNHSTGDLSTLSSMGDAIYHRGPDCGDQFLNESVGLCHRRLSIIDLSEAGRQPMQSSCGDVTIVFNGEIYNFLELREPLAAEGYPFSSHTDTEVLIALYMKHGEQFLNDINGMFALAIWDNRSKKLLLARDRLGKKPLYYYNKDGYFIFGSELKALMKVPGFEKEIRADAVADFFAYQYIPDPKTIFQNTHKLPPGHFMVVDSAGERIEQYWDVDFAQSRSESEEQLLGELENELEGCVSRRMISDVPLGAFLSGGVDSSMVVALMARNSETPVKTCTIGFDSKEYDEVDEARYVADMLGCDHRELTVRESVTDSLKDIVTYFDEPFADPSLVPTYFVSKLARTQVTVALAGDGGDESFAGYEKYAIDHLENQIRNLIPKPVRTRLFPRVARFLSKRSYSGLRRAGTLLNALSHSPAYGFFMTNSFFERALWSKVLKPEFASTLADYDPAEQTLSHYHACKAEDHLSKVLYTDFKTYLPGGILVKVDRMSMANSLEVRAPMLDYRLVEWAASIPSALKLKGKEKKFLLREFTARLVGRDVVNRKKQGFSVPLAEWFRNEIKELAHDTLFAAREGLPDYFNMDEVREIWMLHQSGERDYSSELWSFLVFQIWFDHYILSEQLAA